jgi:hypothetical protein
MAMLAIISLSARLRGERVGVRWGAVQRLRLHKATSPSRAFGAGPSLSPAVRRRGADGGDQ